MISSEEIINAKIDSRCKRNEVSKKESVMTILEDCCIELNVDVPQLICCDTLTKNYSAFVLQGKKYIIYDNGLTESLYLFNAILFEGNNTEDIDKFFYKLFAEELILVNNLPHSLYFTGKYRELQFSFEDNDDLQDVNDQLSRQIYFLLGHELTHLSLKNYKIEVPTQFHDLVLVAVRLLTKRFISETRDEKQVLSEISGYFIKNARFNSIEEYIKQLENSEHFTHFVEECFCDFQGFKLLLEHYSNPNASIYAISNALNYLIMQESLRSDLSEGVVNINNIKKEAGDTLYFSVLRIQMLLIVLEMNKLDGIKIAYDKTYDSCILTEQLEQFILSLPDKTILDKLDDDLLPKISKKQIVSSLIKQLNYCHLL